MTKIRLPLVAMLAMTVLLTACNTLNKATVTLVEAEDAVMKEWARLHNDRATTPEIDLKVIAAHTKFEEAKLIAAIALRNYQAGGDQADYIRALNVVRAAVDPILALIQPLLAQERSAQLQTQVRAATKLE